MKLPVPPVVLSFKHEAYNAPAYLVASYSDLIIYNLCTVRHLGQCMTELLMIYQVFSARFSGGGGRRFVAPFLRVTGPNCLEHEKEAYIGQSSALHEVVLDYRYVASFWKEDDGSKTEAKFGLFTSLPLQNLGSGWRNI